MPLHTLLMFAFLAGFLAAQAVSFTLAWRHANRATDEWRRWASGSSADLASTEEGVWRLDQLLNRNLGMATLRRLTVMAPLLGVIVTAVGFVTMSPTAADAGSGLSTAAVAETLAAIQPLFIGVLLGAALSIENQIAVLLLQRLVDHTRQAVAAQWLLRAPPTTSDGAQALAIELRDLANSLSDVTRQLASDGQTISGALNGMLGHAAESVRELAGACHESAEHLLHSAEVHAGAMTNAGPRIEASIRELAQRVEAGAKIVENQVEQSHAVTKEMSDQLKRAMSNSGKSFAAAIERAAELCERRFDNVASEVDRRANESASRSEQALAAVLRLADPVTAAVPDLQASVSAVAERIASIEAREREAAGVIQSASELASATAAVSEGVVEPLRNAVAGLTEQCTALQAAVVALRQAGDELRSSSSRPIQSGQSNIERPSRQRGTPLGPTGGLADRRVPAVGTGASNIDSQRHVHASPSESDVVGASVAEVGGGRGQASPQPKGADESTGKSADESADQNAPASPIADSGHTRSFFSWFRGR